MSGPSAGQLPAGRPSDDGADCASADVALVWDPELVAYDFGHEHPLSPVRVQLAVELMQACGLVDQPHVSMVGPAAMDDDLLLAHHAAEFVAAVRAGSSPDAGPMDPRWGLGTTDTPAFAGMHDASMRICGASLRAAELVMSGQATHAFNPAGGLHHAMPDRAAGFCIYNDPAVAIGHMLANGADRVAYIDIDVHHGDGVEEIFADDPRVLTVSLHEAGRWLFPGTGGCEDIGGSRAPGSALNLPLAPGTTGDVWLDVFDRVVDPLVRGFAPDALVTQLGCDGHAADPLAHLSLVTDDYADIAARLHTLAHEAAGGRWVALGGGGYQWVHVVPSAWTIAFAEMTGGKLPIETPVAWRTRAHELTGQRAPVGFFDGPVEVADHVRMRAADWAQRAVAAARAQVLPLHGL